VFVVYGEPQGITSAQTSNHVTGVMTMNAQGERDLLDHVERWIGIVKSLGLIALIAFVFKWYRNRQKKRYKLSIRIRNKYYPPIQTTMCLRTEANKVTQDDMAPLRSANSLLNHFNNQILDVLNTGDVSDVDLKDVRQLFSDEAGDLIRELQHYFGELDRIGKDPYAWQCVCSSRVVELSDTILGKWQKLIEIIAHKCWRRVKSLEREFDGWAEGL
jgi:hypothetical protein